MNYTIKNPDELKKMRESGMLLSQTLKLIENNIKVGVTTKELDKLAYDFITSRNAAPAFLNYEGFEYSICASVNEEIVHGFPTDIPLKEGDIVSIDAGVLYEGYNTDAARTFAVGKISAEKQKLIQVTKQCFYEGIRDLKAGSRVGNISHRIQTYAEKNGFSVVRELVGHGVGKQLHEDPMVPNFGGYNTGMVLKENMTIAIEPMINMGDKKVVLKPNGWTIATWDGKPAAHYENTVIITKNGCEIITDDK